MFEYDEWHNEEFFQNPMPPPYNGHIIYFKLSQFILNPAVGFPFTIDTDLFTFISLPAAGFPFTIDTDLFTYILSAAVGFPNVPDLPQVILTIT